MFARAIVLAGLAGSASSQQLLFDELHRMLPAFEQSTRAIVAFDADGDGDLDLATGGENAAAPDRILLNDGGGRFTERTGAIGGKLAHTRALSAGDVDADGDLDLLLGTSGVNRLLLNDGTGLFTDGGAAALVFADDTRDVELADVDGDGDLDAFFANYGSTNRIFLNDGLGAFAYAPSLLASEVKPTLAIGLADLDGDGDIDLAEGLGNLVQFGINDGTGRFVIQGAPAFVKNEDLSLCDLDGDGDADLIAGGLGGARLFFNKGNGKFKFGSLLLTGKWIYTFAPGDLDGDGDVDLCVGLRGNGIVQLENQGGGVFTPGGSPAAVGALPELEALVLADLDGDRDLDLVAGSREYDRLYLNRAGSGELVEVTGPIGASASSSFAVADVDGDGDPDLLCGSQLYETQRLFLNDGGGVFSVSQGWPGLSPGDPFALDVALGDLDLDGDPDAVVLTGNFKQPIGKELFYTNDGSGAFTLAASNFSGAPASVELIDLDGDRDLDVFLGKGYGSQLLFNGGAGSFEPLSFAACRRVFLGDLDGDGDPDALTTSYFSGLSLRLWINSGAGTFVEALQRLPDTDEPLADGALGDVDGDGDLDLALVRRLMPDGLYLNDGHARFTDASARLPAPGDNDAVALGDVDGDGDLDLFTGRSGNGNFRPDRLRLNHGGGFFEEASERLALFPDGTQNVTFADLDQDGDLDVLLGKDDQNVVATNLTHQVAWRAVPRIGQPLTMDVYGPAGASFELNATWTRPATGSTPDRHASGSLARFAGRLDSRGRADVTVAVPADPTLVGRTLYWVAVIGGPAGHVGVTPTVLTDL